MTTQTAMTQECIHERFAARAAERGDAVAVTCGDQSLTYGELDRRSNQLARHLRTLGVGPDVLVGICVERSLDMLVGILGVLKAGGAYVPLDPSYPEERLGFLLSDCGAPVVLTRAQESALLAGSSAEQVRLDGDAFAAEDDGPLDKVCSPENLAYVIYTSGSTGQPKGVLVEHRNLVRLFDATQPWFSFGSDDVWSLFHSFGFDFSVWEIFGALLHGGRLVVVPKEIAKDTEQFYALLASEQVTVLNQTPSAFRQLVRIDGNKGAELALRFVIFGGEALDPRVLAPWFERHGETKPQLVNMYGITETTVHVTYRVMKALDADEARSPIGVPIPDLTLKLLDENGHEVPVGTPGELHVGGAGVARGYLNRPELDAERFVPDPHPTAAGARLYRSGDLAVREADGEICYVGRSDDQVKIRGYRIEPGEIEACLRAHEGVADAAVVAHEFTEGEKRLIAFFVGTGAEAGKLQLSLRAYVEQQLPPQMRPTAFVPLDALPLTAHGKLDRKALPVPEWRPELENEWQASSTPVEQSLVALWEEVLGVQGIGVTDDFFDLGGSSISLVNLFLQIQERFGAELDLSALTEGATIAALAAALPADLAVAP